MIYVNRVKYGFGMVLFTWCFQGNWSKLNRCLLCFSVSAISSRNDEFLPAVNKHVRHVLHLALLAIFGLSWCLLVWLSPWFLLCFKHLKHQNTAKKCGLLKLGLQQESFLVSSLQPVLLSGTIIPL